MSNKLTQGLAEVKTEIKDLHEQDKSLYSQTRDLEKKQPKRKIFSLKYIILFLILAFVLDYAQFGLTSHNYDVPTNGWGAMDSVLRGEAPTPTQFRVLFPWSYLILYNLFGCPSKLHALVWIYEVLKILTIFLALLGIFYFFSLVLKEKALLATLLFCALIPLTFLYDCPDQFLDIFFLSLGFAGIIQNKKSMLNGACFLGALNRETTLLILPVLNFLVKRGKIVKDSVLPFISSGAALLLVLVVYGFRPRYCEYLMIEKNLKNFSIIFQYPQSHGKAFFIMPYFNPMWFFAVAFGFFLYLAFRNLKKSPQFFKSGLILICLYTLICFCIALWREVRIFSWFYLILIPMTLQNES